MLPHYSILITHLWLKHIHNTHLLRFHHHAMYTLSKIPTLLWTQALFLNFHPKKIDLELFCRFLEQKRRVFDHISQIRGHIGRLSLCLNYCDSFMHFYTFLGLWLHIVRFWYQTILQNDQFWSEYAEFVEKNELLLGYARKPPESQSELWNYLKHEHMTWG